MVDRIVDSSGAGSNINVRFFKTLGQDIEAGNEQPMIVDISNCVTISDMLSNIEKFRRENYTSEKVIITTGFNTDNCLKITSNVTQNLEYQTGLFDYYSNTADIEYQCNLYIADELFVGSNITAFSTRYGVSDINLKKDVYEIKSSIDNIEKLRPVCFNWKKDNEKEIGFIAQEVEEVFPNLVKSNQYKTLKENKLIPYLVDCVKTLKYRIEKLKQNEQIYK